MKQRVKLIHSEHPKNKKKVNVSSLRKIYAKYKIKYKKIRTRKCWRRNNTADKIASDNIMLQ